jgi:Scaffold protein Nfu/NifU N terminal
MLSRIALLPVRAARRIARFVLRRGRSEPPSTPAYSAPPARYEPEEEEAEEHAHDHGHSHDHGHAHDHAEPIEVRAEETPNPSAMKFVVGVPVGSFDLSSAEQAADHAIARSLFAIDGVRSVFGRNDFVTVTKTEEADWDELSHQVVEALEKALA